MTFWRSVGHSYTAFAKESMIDEMAEAAGMDEVAFRLQNTQSTPRLNNVIRVAGEHMAKMNPPEGHHLGFAAHHSFYTDVAEIAEVSVENGKIRVHKVTCVLDCGQAVNPDIVRSQIEGGVIYVRARVADPNSHRKLVLDAIRSTCEVQRSHCSNSWASTAR